MDYLIPIILQLLRDLSLTITIELAVIYVLGFRKKTEFLTIIVINLITNPLANMLFQFKLIQFSIPNIILIEVLIVLVEAMLLTKVLNKNKWRMILLSFAINFASFITGVLLFWK